MKQILFFTIFGSECIRYCARYSSIDRDFILANQGSLISFFITLINNYFFISFLSNTKQIASDINADNIQKLTALFQENLSII